MGLGISAPPITYGIGDRQYVALLVGWGSTPATSGGMDNYLAGLIERTRAGWSCSPLTASTTCPHPPPPAPPLPLDDPAFEVDEQLVVSGADVYGSCRMCHGGGAISGGAAPDLRASPVVLANAAFDAVVRGGALKAQGMPGFPALSDEHLEGLQHYVRRQARKALGLEPATVAEATGGP